MRKVLLFILIVFSRQVFAQTDTIYCKSYAHLITGRFYFSQKYTRLNLRNNIDKYDLGYRPNTTLNMGIGATYKWATLNLAYGFPVLNPERGQGKTKYLDLQAHFYGPKLTIDLFGQFYKGFFLYPKGTFANKNEYYVRPDLKVNALGASVQYVLNNRRFSYRASFLQNEWQRKSAGSLIAGAEIYFGRITADSSIVASETKSISEADKVLRFDYFEIGPNVGYAYTLVIRKNFFVTGSFALSFDYVTNTAHSNSTQLKSDGFSPNSTFRFFTGYNSTLHAFSITFVNSDVSLTKQNAPTKINVSTGNFRLNYVKRFKPGPKSKRFLRHI